MTPIRNTFEPRALTARAPAKLIISGEHSVLYGQPALAMAVNRYTTTTASWSDSSLIHFKLLDLAYAKAHTARALKLLAKNLRHEYDKFLAGNVTIRSVLKRPFELLQYSVSSLLEYINMQLPKGLEIAVDSNIPMGCGMGSSASAVISTLYALANFLQLDWQRKDFLAFSRNIENLQHGKSSGLDLHLVTYGGCVLFHNGEAQTRRAPQTSLCIVNTGKPDSSTGECVAAAALHFAEHKSLAVEFAEITHAIDMALATEHMPDVIQGIRANHKLLQRIGVVPAKVADFISDIEASGGAAKICGAGAIQGDNAGIVLLYSQHAVQEIVDAHGFLLQNIQVDTHGTQIV